MLKIDRPLVVTVTECSQLLRIPRSKVYSLIEHQVLHGVKVGGSWRVRIGSVEKILGETISADFFKQGKVSYEKIRSAVERSALEGSVVEKVETPSTDSVHTDSV